MRKTLLIILLAAGAKMLSAQETDGNFPPPKNPKEVIATRAKTNIKVDGQLNEQDWQQAIPISDFFKIEPRQGGAYTYKTEVRILFDDKNLYIGTFCADSLGKKGVRVQDLRRDFNWGENDIFGVQLDPQNLKQYAVSFQTTPYGNQRDLQNFNDQSTDNDWNALWTVRTSRTDEGYYAEFAIPFKSLRYDASENGEETAWGITFTRLARRNYEQTVFPAIPQSFSPYRMTYAAQLKGLELPDPSANVRVEPYALYQYENENNDGAKSSGGDFKLGGDVKWAVNPNTVVDLTFNTDFAQADVDRAVNNLERFNIFFPERRQFFLENSGIWSGSNQFAIRPFFSRKIGLAGDFNAEPAPIDVGARFTQRDEKQTLAGLYIHQAETDISQAGNFGVLRYTRNYGNENNIGVMFTHRLDESSDDLALGKQNNSTFTVDGLFRPSSIWTVNYLASVSSNYEQDELGLSARVFAGRSANKSYWGWVTEYIDSKYDPAMGFISQSNVIKHNPGGYWIVRPKKLNWIRRWDPGFFVNYYHDADNPGNFQQASIYFFPIYVFFTDGSFVEYAVTPTWQNINFNFAPLGIDIAEGDYFYVRHNVNFRTDQSKKWSLSGSYDWGEFYNGKQEKVEAGARLAPSPYFAVNFDYEFIKLRNLGEQSEDLDTHLTTVGARFALNPRIQLSSFYQHNTFDDQGRWNVRFSWEYQPLSFVYLVFNSNNIDTTDRVYKQDQTIAKVTFLKQF
ncbi:DUF5916 domain-containing protein [Roseivirga pacifica]|uniref:DUF5916 domain-containing protein n=1 Tax=Roseivirga pacifica TaxID=1267423 RepID=UPI003BB0618B